MGSSVPTSRDVRPSMDEPTNGIQPIDADEITVLSDEPTNGIQPIDADEITVLSAEVAADPVFAERQPKDDCPNPKSVRVFDCNTVVDDENTRSICAPLCGTWSTCQDKRSLGQARKAVAVDLLSRRSCTAVNSLQGNSGGGVVFAFDDGCVGVSLWFADEPLHTLAVQTSVSFGVITCLGFDMAGGLLDPEVPVVFYAGTDKGMVMEFELDAENSILDMRNMWKSHTQSPLADVRFSGVTSVAADGIGIVTGGADSSVAIWSKDDTKGDIAGKGAKLMRRVDGSHGGAVTAVGIGASLPCAVTGGEDGVVRLWSSAMVSHRSRSTSRRKESPVVKEETEIDMVLPSHAKDQATERTSGNSVHVVSVDSKYHRLCTGGEDSFVRIWDLSCGRPTRRLAHEPVAKLSNKGARSVAASEVMGGCHPKFEGVTAVALDVEETPTQLASGASNGSLRIWDVREHTPIFKNDQAHAHGIAALSLQGTRLITSSMSDCQANMWDLRHLDTPVESSSFYGLKPFPSAEVSKVGRRTFWPY
eukprot:TRINITY_DN12414_c0_g1_i1.p1 TRINITY_DN12414_c0_g1~~TRINITY_DN12414_c0_g1_i1.p1  ORF type:complete len:533 (-),score=87.40 TRINITY_DN12414_c0_g1_i1:96-1694(-)